jgi:hypothetical protein
MKRGLGVAAFLLSFSAWAADGGTLPVAVPQLLHYRAFITDRGSPVDSALFASIDVTASDGVDAPLWHKNLLATNPEVHLQTGVLDVDLGQGDASNYLADALAQIQGASGTPTVDVTVGLTTGDTIHLRNVVRSVPFAAYAQSVVGSIPGTQIAPGTMPGSAATAPFALTGDLSAAAGTFTSVQTPTVSSPNSYSLGGGNNLLYGSTTQNGPLAVNGNLALNGTMTSGNVPFQRLSSWSVQYYPATTPVYPLYTMLSPSTDLAAAGNNVIASCQAGDIAMAGGCVLTAVGGYLANSIVYGSSGWLCTWYPLGAGAAGQAWVLCMHPQP